MPTYEYRCPNGHVFEKFYPKISDKRHVKCPACGKQARRLISGGTGLVFRGSGFYTTDYKRAGEKTDKKTPEGDTKSSDTAKSKKDSSSTDK